jgi:PAB-dependent poly(A)-specific ribonuclease subunit 2
LPGRYKRVEIKKKEAPGKFDFEFSAYNRTRFAGLENDIANCYANALVQVWKPLRHSELCL